MRFYFDTFLLGFVFVIFLLIGTMIREAFITPSLGLMLSDLIVKVALLLLIIGISYTYVTGIGDTKTKQQILHVSLIWLSIMVVFDIFFNRLALNLSWHRIFEHYNLANGRIMLLILLAEFFSPILFYRKLKRE